MNNESEKMSKDEFEPLAAELKGNWKIIDEQKLMLEYTAENFMYAVDLINHIAEKAEEISHHPDLALTGYKNLGITISTHSAGGLTKKDFELAKAIDKILSEI